MTAFNIPTIVQALKAARKDWRNAQRRAKESGGREFPSTDAMVQILADLKGILFPMRLGPSDLRQESEDFYVGFTLNTILQTLLEQVRLELKCHCADKSDDIQTIDERAVRLVQEFAQGLPGIRRMLDSDVLAAYHGDPAANSVDEVLLCYPGVSAMIHHRVAHQFYRLGLPLLARVAAELAHGQTGIDIHPGAQIGGSFFIDHGTGVVIGETAIIGERVRIYQAVTLGAKRFPTDDCGKLQKGLPRHPIVEDDVVIYAGATILGRVTLGRGCTIGGNVWLTRDVPPGQHVTQAESKDTKIADPIMHQG
jgi:serine O-acetyltransferase